MIIKIFEIRQRLNSSGSLKADHNPFNMNYFDFTYFLTQLDKLLLLYEHPQNYIKLIFPQNSVVNQNSLNSK